MARTRSQGGPPQEVKLIRDLEHMQVSEALILPKFVQVWLVGMGNSMRRAGKGGLTLGCTPNLLQGEHQKNREPCTELPSLSG